MKFDVYFFFRKSVSNIHVSCDYDKNSGTVHADRYVYIFYYIWLNSFCNEKYFRQKLKRKSKHTVCVQQLCPKNRAFYEKTWKNILQPERPQMKIWRMRIACWVPRSDCVIITVFLLPSGGTKAPH
jgi:hypothetical protein